MDEISGSHFVLACEANSESTPRGVTGSSISTTLSGSSIDTPRRCHTRLSGVSLNLSKPRGRTSSSRGSPHGVNSSITRPSVPITFREAPSGIHRSIVHPSETPDGRFKSSVLNTARDNALRNNRGVRTRKRFHYTYSRDPYNVKANYTDRISRGERTVVRFFGVSNAGSNKLAKPCLVKPTLVSTITVATSGTTHSAPNLRNFSTTSGTRSPPADLVKNNYTHKHLNTYDLIEH